MMPQHPSTLLVIVVAAISTTGAAMAHRGLLAASTPAAARFWEQALPGTPMPEIMAYLVQKGIDQSPLVEHYPTVQSISTCTLPSAACERRTVAETGVFFHEAELRPGNTMTLSFPAEVETPILPHDVAGKVPFQNLSDVLATFHITPGSAEAAQVEQTLSRCQRHQHSPAAAGCNKAYAAVAACATSLESTVQAAMEILGTTTSQLQGGGGDGGDHVWVVASALPRGGRLPRRQYKVQAVTPLVGSRYASCHRAPFPYAVYQCHSTSTGDRGHMVSLRGQGGPAVSLLSFCHVDTSGWNPAHPVFQILNTHPGGTAVCHFMPLGDTFFGLVNKADRA